MVQKVFHFQNQEFEKFYPIALKRLMIDNIDAFEKPIKTWRPSNCP